MNIPADHPTVMPYLIIGNAEAFFDFAQTVFDEKELTRHDDEIKTGQRTILFSSVNSNREPQTAGLFIYTDNADASYKKAPENGATSIMEPADKTYGRSCGVPDAFGNTWCMTNL